MLLRRAWYGLNQAFRRRIQHTGLTPDQFTALRNLIEAGEEGLNQSRLTDNMSSDPNTIASLVTRMASAGLIKRDKDPKDRRAYRLTISQEGRNKYDEARKVAITLQNDVLAALPGRSRESFLRDLSTIADCCMEISERPSWAADRSRGKSFQPAED